MIAFKEWARVCRALEHGEQVLMFRKGGIHEGREGFSFKHEAFYLFPTHFHSKAEHLKVQDGVSQPEWKIGDEVEITSFAHLEWARTLTDWQQVCQLDDYHIYTEKCLRERFDWTFKELSGQSIHCALARVVRLDVPHRFRYEKSHGGCRSWVEIPDRSNPADKWAGEQVIDPVMFGKINADVHLRLGI